MLNICCHQLLILWKCLVSSVFLSLQTEYLWLWTRGRTKRAISICHVGFWEIVLTVFFFLQFSDNKMMNENDHYLQPQNFLFSHFAFMVREVFSLGVPWLRKEVIWLLFVHTHSKKRKEYLETCRKASWKVDVWAASSGPLVFVWLRGNTRAEKKMWDE